MKAIAAAAVVLVLGGCAHVQQPKQSAPVVVKAKHPDPCPCSPTANETVKKRWFSGWKIRFLH